MHHLFTSAQALNSGKKVCNFLIHPSVRKAVHSKYAGEVQKALKQIKEKRYYGKLNGYSDVLLVGINYDKNSKKHECTIDRASLKEKTE